MRIVDTHCHTTPVWYEPVESLLYQMDRNHVEKAVLIQIMGNYDNEYQYDCVAKHPDRLSSVVMVNVDSPTALDDLAAAADRGAVGVRLEATMRSPGDDPFAIWRKAGELGLVVSCVGDPRRFASYVFSAMVEQVQETPIVIEHLGGMKASTPPTMQSMNEKVFDLARFSNVSMKIHGLGEVCTRNTPLTSPFPFNPAGVPLLQRAVAEFGPKRIMWGSDYPPVSGREGYANALNFTMEALADRSETEREAIFGGTAERIWKLA